MNLKLQQRYDGVQGLLGKISLSFHFVSGTNSVRKF